MASHQEFVKRMEVARKKSPLGSGGKFKALSKEVASNGAKDPNALAAWIGRNKYGKSKFQKMAAAGKK